MRVHINHHSFPCLSTFIICMWEPIGYWLMTGSEGNGQGLWVSDVASGKPNNG